MKNERMPLREKAKGVWHRCVGGRERFGRRGGFSALADRRVRLRLGVGVRPVVHTLPVEPTEVMHKQVEVIFQLARGVAVFKQEDRARRVAWRRRCVYEGMRRYGDLLSRMVSTREERM
jgi:hypothetical protein